MKHGKFSKRTLREAALAAQRLKPWGRMEKPPLCPRTACCLQDMSSSHDDDLSWASLERMSGPQGSKACGFDSELEEWSFYLRAANHFEELERDVASHAASHPKWITVISRAKLSWRKTKTGRRRARRVGWGVQLCPLLKKSVHVMLA
eukprot:5944125-Amphidinium_carterae.1